MTTLTRRQTLGLGAAALAVSMLSGCGGLERRLTRRGLSSPKAVAGDAPSVRLLNRLAYGPTPEGLSALQSHGWAAFIESQLAQEDLAESDLLTWRLRALGDTLNADAGTLFDQDDRRVVQTLRQAALLRAVYSRRQLFERMVEFWSDHFNVYAFKGEGPQWSAVYQTQVIRRFALGRFRDLLGATAKSAAMLGYLDNGVNVKGHPNENYARELFELHTLGVHGGYTQADIQEAARCFTGWTSERHWHRGRFRFDAAAHDDGPKAVLGVTLAGGGGRSDGERALDLAAAHPATARHLAQKLCLRFVGAAPARLVDHLAAVWRQSEGDIKAVLRALCLSDAILTGPPILKRPWDYAVSALRALDADTDGALPLQRHLEAMGQAPYGWPRPDGFPDRADAWTGGLLHRWNFALALCHGGIAGTEIELTEQDALRERIFALPAASPCLAALRDLASAHPDLHEYAALLLMSPEFQWR